MSLKYCRNTLAHGSSEPVSLAYISNLLLGSKALVAGVGRPFGGNFLNALWVKGFLNGVQEDLNLGAQVSEQLAELLRIVTRS